MTSTVAGDRVEGCVDSFLALYICAVEEAG